MTATALGSWLLPLLLLLAPSPAPAAGAAAPVVVDGDGLRLGAEEIRLWGVDAPERDQVCAAAVGVPYPCGRAAEDALAGLVRGREVRCAPVGVDRHGRTVARCFAGGRDLGGELVRLGWALDYRRFSEGFYEGLEAEARRGRRGLWAGTFDRPSAWRRDRHGCR